MIIIHYLEGCPYCIEAEKQLKILKIKYKKIIVKQQNKESFKKKFKMKTFPQIFLKRSKNLSKIGGLEDFKKLIEVCRIIKKYELTQAQIKFIKTHV
tara:strand:- start:506 stop:796 length:291 start_codon:yes stop_codon:yes gene_type:complete